MSARGGETAVAAPGAMGSARLRFRDLPIRRKLTLLMMLSGAAGLLVSGLTLMALSSLNARRAAERDLASVAGIIADSATAAVAFRDAVVAEQLLGGLRTKPEIVAACLYIAEGEDVPQLFAQLTQAGNGCPAMPATVAPIDGLQVRVPVIEAGARLGWLVLEQDLAPLKRDLLAQITLILLILLASFLASLGIAWMMQPVLAGPILGLAEVAQRVAQTRDYSLRAERHGLDEVGKLVDDFNTMLQRIELASHELKRTRDELAIHLDEKILANRDLEQALSRLQDAQSQLVQSERLASLGALVAGVAHEINTPVGIGVTAASTLQDRARELRRMYESGQLKKSELERFIEVANESCEILLKNLNRAAGLIHSFKHVAVDQSSGERRRFDLREYLDEVLLSLLPQLKKSGHAVEVTCPAGIEVDTYPGALAQIVANFVGNSVLHAYPGGRSGHLKLRVMEQDGAVVLHYADDGCGIGAEHLGKVFDPFFTTKRGSGGSGLGLHIVYNLVTQILGGTIEARSEPGRGAEFVVRFPRERRKTIE